MDPTPRPTATLPPPHHLLQTGVIMLPPLPRDLPRA